MTTELSDIDTSTDPLSDLGLDFSIEAIAIHEAAENATFQDVETIRPVTERSIKRTEEGLKRIADFVKSPRTGEPLYLDFETIPDFERLPLFDLPPLPEMPPIDASESLMSADEFVSQTVPEIEAWLARHNPPPEWVANVESAERAGKKPRKGCMDAIVDHRKRINSIANADRDRIKLLSTRPFYCSICAVSFAVGGGDPISFSAVDANQERKLLEATWDMVNAYSPLIGFNVKFFDARVLLVRSMVLGVKPTKYLDLRKYGSKDIVDLCQDLFDGNLNQTIDLKTVCESLGIIPDSDCDGSKVFGLWKAGKVDEICLYCESDVRLVQRLHREKMAGYFCV